MFSSSPGLSWRPADSRASVDHASAVTGTRKTSWAGWLAMIKVVPSRLSPRALNARCPDSTGMRLNRKSVRSEERPISTASSTKSASAEETSVELVAPARVPSGATERGVPSSGLSNSTSVSADSVSPTCLRRARLHVSWEGTPARAAPTRAAARVKGGSLGGPARFVGRPWLALGRLGRRRCLHL